MYAAESLHKCIHAISPFDVKLTDDQANEIGKKILESTAHLSGDERAYQLALQAHRLKKEYRS